MVPYDKTKTFPQSLFLKYAIEMYQDNPEIAKNEWKLYPSEEKTFYLQKRFLLLTQDDGHSPCAMVRAGQGKVRIFHSLILHEYDNLHPLETCLRLARVTHMDGDFVTPQKK